MGTKARVAGILFAISSMISISYTACTTDGGQGKCEPGQMRCSTESAHVILVCGQDGSTWKEALCSEGELCYHDRCQPLECVPGTSECWGDGYRTCNDDGQGWGEVVPCPDGEVCAHGRCGVRVCSPGETRCSPTGLVERCEEAGMAWEPYYACAQDETCVSGRCVPSECSDGDKTCGSGALLVCTGGTWTIHPCAEDEWCVFDMCLQCLDDGDCGAGFACSDGRCEPSEPSIVEEEPPLGVAGQHYSYTFMVHGGLGPYTWDASPLPAGLTLDGSTLAGVPDGTGVFDVHVRVTDARSSTDDATFTFQFLDSGPVTILTSHLPEAETDTPYDTRISASGGLPPYAWQLLEGTLPDGLLLLANGTIQGSPTEVGTFPLTIRVVDGSTPPGWDTRTFSLVVRAAPLEVYGDQEYDLLFTKVIVLDVLVPYVPYRQELSARGGVRPYRWAEERPPAGLDFVIKDWGLPDGLSLSSDGVISGTVTDVSDAQDVYLPGGTHLKGYFVYVVVRDSQAPPFESKAVYCVPTVPVE